MDLSNVTTNKSGDPTVTITLTGYHDMAALSALAEALYGPHSGRADG